MTNKCGESVKGDTSLFHSEEGGSIPTSPHKFMVHECKFKDIRTIFEDNHYKGGAMGGGISFCLALMWGNKIMGGVVVGKPRHEGKYKQSLDIRRMACIEESPKNSESYFLAKTIWWIKKHYPDVGKVISYSDLTEGHVGTIYKASNFKQIGETSKSKVIVYGNRKYHMRSLTIDRPYSYDIRKAIESGEAYIEEGLPKLIWEYSLK